MQKIKKNFKSYRIIMPTYDFTRKAVGNRVVSYFGH